jgi:hypothetical protein
MQCIICQTQDEPSNLVELSEIESGYAHPRCINRHNRTAAKNLYEIEVSMIADEISDHDIDATDPGAVERFFYERNRKVSERRVVEIVAAATKRRERDNRRWLFERLEGNVKPWPAEADEAFINDIADELSGLSCPPVDLSARRYAARLLVLQVAWRKDVEASKAACEEYEQGEVA